MTQVQSLDPGLAGNHHAVKVRVVGYRDEVPEEMVVIDTTSKAKGWSRGLSPMVLGPVTAPGGLTAQTVENMWQYSKVYLEDWDPSKACPRPHWYQWRREGFMSHRAVRYPKGRGAKPVCSWLGGGLEGPADSPGRGLDYISARKLIYVPAYTTAVRETVAFRTLRELYLMERPQSIYLRDFDGYDHIASGMSLYDVLHCAERPMGHAFCLAAMLEGLA